MDSQAEYFGAFFLIGLVVGLLIGRWWALVLAILVPIPYVGAGEDTHGNPEWMWALVLLAPVTLVGIAAGVALRRVWSWRQARPRRARLGESE